MIMRFRPANISLINRRHYLPRLLLTLFSKGQMQKPHQRFEDVDRVTPYQFRIGGQPGTMEKLSALLGAPEGGKQHLSTTVHRLKLLWYQGYIEASSESLLSK
jgi:hypothetical protein